MLTDLLTEIATSGWLFSNCYQYDAGLWRVNLRRPDDGGDWFTDWAEGETLEEALEECMGKLASAEFEAHKAISHKIDTSKVPSGLMARLGLGPKEPMRRRI